MLKFGFRNNNFYPLMLLLFIFLRICVDKILKVHPYKKNIDFVISFLIFFSQSLIGGLIRLYYYCKRKRMSEKYNQINLTYTQVGAIKLIMNKSYKPTIKRYKKYLLINFASFFNFIGTIIRSDDVINFGQKQENNSQLEIRIRSVQIIISSLICYFTIRLNIYKHQKLSLIVISFFLLFLIIMELVITSNIKNKILSILICVMSCLSRAFLDVTEKYLFDFDYINILSMLIYEGVIGLIFFVIFFSTNSAYQKQGLNILKDMSELGWPFMSRALFESTLDPFLFLYNFLTQNTSDGNSGKWIYFSLVVFSLSVIAFFSLIYNDFIILYCCGLEYNTYKGINSRIESESVQRNESIDSFLDNDSDEGNRGKSFEMKNVA